ncbi:AEC family transporter [Amorphus coralli]|uniref:AEC family transporter n=1 Tax=Amorphus coralli TaxID=340680 RepID=UPI00037E66D2|nr:AEC family transporter [Amorphus coralli]
METLALVVPVFAVMLTGFAMVRLGILPATIAGPLVQFVYRVSLPALMFRIVAEDSLSSILDWKFWLAFGGGTLLLLILARLVAGRWLGDNAGQRAILSLSAVQTNTGFVALPILHSLFGAAGVPPAAVANIIIAGVFFPIGVAMLVAARGSTGTRPSWTRIGRDVLLSPLVWPTLLGLVFASFAIPIPAIVDDYLAILAAALTPGALFAIGASLDLKAIRYDIVRIAALSVVKLAVLPALVFAVAMALDMAPFTIIAVTICAAVPTAKSVYFLAEEYDVAQRDAAAVISATTLASVVTLSLWLVALAEVFPEAFHSRIAG